MLKRTARRVLALAATGVLVGAITAGGASAQPAPNDAPEAFAGCIAGAHAADILIVMDESESLVGFAGEQATDPSAVRVKAATDFAHHMAAHAAATGADISVAIAGFADDYRTHSGWTTLRHTDQGSNIDAAIAEFTERTDGSYTNYEAGLAGAFRDLSQRPSTCRAVLFFSDGQPTASSYGQPMEPVCAADGPVAKLRSSGIRVFTIGLGPDTAETMQPIAAGQCSAEAPNGVHLQADEPAALYAAFRRMIPNGAHDVRDGGPATDPYRFTLDESTQPVRLSVQPDRTIAMGALIPTLTPPGGQPVDLADGAQRIAGAEVTVQRNAEVPGMVDADLRRAADGEWAGQWSFGYRIADASAEQMTYRAVLTVIPGLSLVVPGAEDTETMSVSSSDSLPVEVRDPDGQVRAFAGQARLDAVLRPDDGSAPVDIARGVDLRSGAGEVEFSSIDGRAAGVLELSLFITTAGGEGVPGTALKPLTFRKPISVAPATAPKLPGSVVLEMTGVEASTPIEFTGPGAVWIDDGEFSVGDAVVNYTSDHDAAAPLTLGPGETGTIIVRTSTADPIDRVIADSALEVTAQDSESGATEVVQLPLRGSLSAPINTTVFGIALVGALVLALAIPLVVLYAMKYLAGRIPRSPGVLALRIPVRRHAGELVRTDTGGVFTVDFDEVVRAPRTTSTGRSINLAGTQVRVRGGLNPLRPPMAVAEHTPSIADDGARHAGAAQLPLAVHNHWFVLPGEVVVAVDERIRREALAAIVADIRAHAPQRLETIGDKATQAPEPTAPARRTGGFVDNGPNPFGDSGRR
ncbi:VWA domain-containing protein [Corynebacterium sp. TAE3-ERU12]|uniref:vWA domain-containing protein n=1 Tax=Corynebacterium sp. TAE3-ERU12 TaxID=2849491 RepID=UPI001C46F03C|nr:vWA domain-containing protein [Corynebacterium sp. TAE3-ERU12]MBV7294585.1 VWA domain-containing protein [Corynebacterium sp. TAE3-ERU12]